jgi:hypothetical protein
MLKTIRSGLALALFIALPAIHANEQAQNNSANDILAIVFSEMERQLIKEYYGNKQSDVTNSSTGPKSKGLPPGLANRDTLPPGLAKQLQRNGTLPPGLTKRDLPADLMKQLPRVQEGYERSIIEEVTVVLIETATGRIADIILDAVTEEDNNRSRPGRPDR